MGIPNYRQGSAGDLVAGVLRTPANPTGDKIAGATKAPQLLRGIAADYSWLGP
jgi:hypothetical protein